MKEKTYTLFRWTELFNTAEAVATQRTKPELEKFLAENPRLAVSPRDFIIVEEKPFGIYVAFEGAAGEDEEMCVSLTIGE